MIHKIRNIKDLEGLTGLSNEVYKTIYEFVNVYEQNYGTDGIGGYVLYAEKGTSIEDIKAIFDYDINTIEFVDRSVTEPFVYTICFLVGTEFGIILVISEDDIPEEIKSLYREE